jgi:hypothetical protein
VDAFPATMYQHGKFFGTTILYNKKSQRRVVKITHKVLMKETALELKRKMMEWLKVNRVWIQNGNLDLVETSVFGWMLQWCFALCSKIGLLCSLNTY